MHKVKQIIGPIPASYIAGWCGIGCQHLLLFVVYYTALYWAHVAVVAAHAFCLTVA